MHITWLPITMELDRSTYEGIVASLDQLLHSKDCLKQLATQFPE